MIHTGSHKGKNSSKSKNDQAPKLQLQRGIATFDFKQSEHYAQISKGVKMKFVDFPLPATMDVFKDKLLIISWENVTGILISSKEIAEHFRNYFNSMWKPATR